MASTCGKVKADGTNCTRPAGWGLQKHSGPCKDHSKGKAAKVASLKKQVIELLGDPLNTMSNVSEQCGVAVRTLYEWRYTDEAFDADWITITAERDRVRVAIVEDNLFRRACDLKANPAETIFYLKNRAPHRWRDKVEREITGKDGAPLIDIKALRALALEGDDEYDE